MRKRGHIVPLHLSGRELKHLNDISGQSGLSREEFLRSLIMGAQIRAKPCPHYADLLRKVAEIGRASCMERV